MDDRTTENREAFLQRLRAPPVDVFLSSDDIARVELAYDLSKYAHRAQGRKDGTRYFEHPRHVALLLIDGLALHEMPAIVAALLHDAFEDSPQYVTPEKIEVIGGHEAARMVRLLSKVPKQGYADRLRMADWKTLAIKLCDRVHNTGDLEQADAAFRLKQVRETRETYLPLFRKLVAMTPASHADAVGVMVARLEEAIGRWPDPPTP